MYMTMSMLKGITRNQILDLARLMPKSPDVFGPMQVTSRVEGLDVRLYRHRQQGTPNSKRELSHRRTSP